MGKSDNDRRYDASIKGKYRRGKSRARESGLTWTLTLPEYEALIASGLCHYCGDALNPYGSSLDRKNNSEGYTPDNCVAACSRCNSFKSDFLDYREMKLVLALLRAYRDGTDC